jgi:hypothetical protein
MLITFIINIFVGIVYKISEGFYEQYYGPEGEGFISGFFFLILGSACLGAPIFGLIDESGVLSIAGREFNVFCGAFYYYISRFPT